MSMKKRAAAFALIFLLLSAGIAGAEEEIPSLPMDFSGGKKLQERFYTGEWSYEDPTISVVIETGREDNCDWWVADVKIQHPSQLRTASAGGFNTNMNIKGTALAKRVNAVLALDGDYYCYTGKGFILRQGETFLKVLDGDRDVLLIDEDGDFHVVYQAQADMVGETVEDKKVVNAFYFGPVLVDGGEAIRGVYGKDMAAEKKRQRMCIAQVDKLHYKVVCCAAPARGSAGMTLQQFADFVARQDVQVAYNLDGGDSTMLIFKNEKINDVRNQDTRLICDILYFASAYEGE